MRLHLHVSKSASGPQVDDPAQPSTIAYGHEQRPPRLPADDREVARDYPEQITVGGEYLFMDLLALRAGYVFPADEQGFSFGAGAQTGRSGMRSGLNYAYTLLGVLGNVNRLAMAFAR